MAKILVIDDHPELRELFGEVLTIAGHEVLTAADGSLGLALYARYRPVLVITDMEVPGISGLEIIVRLRGEPGVKVIAISGSSRENLLAARAVGAAVTLKKPFGVNDLPRGRGATSGRTAAGLICRPEVRRSKRLEAILLP